MSLNGTKTHDNLKEAFAGEIQANRRYMWFAQKADVEGYPAAAASPKSPIGSRRSHAPRKATPVVSVRDSKRCRTD